MKMGSKATVFTSTAVIFACGATVHAAPYLQTFDNTTGSSNTTVSTVGWAAYHGASATPFTTTMVNGSTGIVTALAHSLGNPNTTPKGYLFSAREADRSTAVHTGITPIVNAETISWKQGNNSASVEVYPLVQVEGNWYASSTPFTSTAYSTGTNFANASDVAVTKTLTFSTNAANWRNFTHTSSSSMELGGVLGSDLPSSTITGIGFFFDFTASTQVVRIDTLAVTEMEVVPEPSMIGAVAAGALFARRRRRA